MKCFLLSVMMVVVTNCWALAQGPTRTSPPPGPTLNQLYDVAEKWSKPEQLL